MGKRIVAIFSTVLILLTICAGRVLALSLWDDTLAQTAANQQQYTLSIPTGRGNFYDRSGKALTGNGKKRYLAAVAPDQQAAAALQKVLPVSRMGEVADLLESGKPFLVSLDAPVQADSVVCVPQTMRYSSAAPAAHLIGYLDGGGHGVSGLEKAYDELLGSGSGGTTVTYTVDALGHFLAGEKPVVVTQEMQAPEGIALTLDADLQKTVEQAADRYLQKGAVVVLEAGSGQILASASVPAFDPSDVAASMKDTDGPFVNRALQPYTVGSVFKLAAASAALESGQNPDAPYTCTGAQEVEGRLFHCYGGEAHGVVTMRQAIAQSCNSYFVHLMQSVQPASFLHMAQLLGFGEKDTLAPGFAAAAGELPTLRSLASKQALANFSFGQGVLTATPLQVYHAFCSSRGERRANGQGKCGHETGITRGDQPENSLAVDFIYARLRGDRHRQGWQTSPCNGRSQNRYSADRTHPEWERGKHLLVCGLFPGGAAALRGGCDVRGRCKRRQGLRPGFPADCRYTISKKQLTSPVDAPIIRYRSLRKRQYL